LRDINYAARLWQVFKAIISGPLNELKELLGDAVTLVIETAGSRYFCESLFWASQPKQAAKT
jgi:hypothetical protein